MANSGSQQYLYTGDGADDDNDFTAVRAALDPVLERHGFTPLGATEFTGPSVNVTTTDTIGAELEIVSRQYSVVQLTAPVLSPTCDSTELGIP